MLFTSNDKIIMQGSDHLLHQPGIVTTTFFSFCWPQLLTKITHQHFLTYRHRHFCINFKLIDPFFIDDFLVENLSLKMANGFIFGDLENII
jgi:hypothetical protein